jgi:hypothetical protein
VAEAGVELSPKSSGKTAKSETGGAESGALGPDGLDRVIEAWPTLSDGQRRAILQLVGQAR